MPLYEIRCKSGHLTEVLVRGANTPLTCKECGEVGEIQPSVFVARGVDVPDPIAPTAPKRNRPKYIKRMGGGMAYKTEFGGYRPAITHTATCPKCKRRRNVAVVNKLPWGVRLNCEACAHQWIHQEETAADPLLEGIDRTLTPGKMFSAHVSPGDQYIQPERGA